MGFLSFIKGMKIEDNCPIDVTFRTSRSSNIFGALLMFAGLSLVWQICWGNAFFCFFNIIFAVTIALAFSFFLVGLLIVAYRKCVIVSKVQSKIEYMESGILTRKRTTINFQDILYLELCPVIECVISSQACMWTIKAYLRRHNGFDTIRLFECIDQATAEEASTLLSQVLSCQVVSGNSPVAAQIPQNQIGF